MTTNEIVTALKAHALQNYEHNGWDYLVECYSDENIVTLIIELGVSDADDAISKVGRILRVRDEIRTDALAEIF